MKDQYIFVYGSLKKGQRLNSYLENEEYIGPVDTSYNFSLISFNVFPALIKGVSSVHGDLYRVKSRDIIAILDRVEGVPLLYDRKKIKLRNSDIEPWAYVMNDPYSYHGFGFYDVKYKVERDSFSWEPPVDDLYYELAENDNG